MEYTPIDLVTAVSNPQPTIAAAYGLERIMVDGNDADAVHVEAKRTVERARAGEGPSLVELTYRHGGTARPIPRKYRPADEIEA